MTSDPRLTYRAFASAAMALVMFLIRYVAPDVPNEFYPLFSGFWMAAWGAGEVWYDNRRSVKS
jgi:hypothetical protein